MTRRPLTLLLVLGLLLAGIDIPAPAHGVVVDRERIGGMYTRRIDPTACDFWRCPSTLTEWRLPRYVVTYRWELAGISGETRCTVAPGRFWQAQPGDPFRCNPQEGTP